MVNASSDQTEPRPKRRWLGLMKLAVTVALLAIILHFISIEDIWAGIRRTSIEIWLLVLAGFLVGHVFAAFKWRLLVGQNIDLITVLRAHFAGLAANIALPGVAGGDVARAAVLSKQVESPQTLITGSIIDRLIDVTILVLIAALGAALLGTTGSTGQWIQIAAAGFITLGILVYLFIPALSRLIDSKLGGEGASKASKMIVELFAYIAAHRLRIVLCALLSFAIQTSFVGLNVILAWSMQGPTQVAMWLFAWPLAKLIATLPISIGGLGVREASLAAVFTAFGSGSPVIVAVGLVWQTILISTGLIGLGVQFLSKRGKTEPIGDQNVRPGTG